MAGQTVAQRTARCAVGRDSPPFPAPRRGRRAGWDGHTRGSGPWVWQDRFDAVVDFYEAAVPEANHDRELERELQARLRAHPPFLTVTAGKGWNDFVYQRVDVQARPYAGALQLDRQRVANVYETTFRLVAELGLPLRLGEEAPDDDSVLAAVPFPAAIAAWSALVAANTPRRPVALVCPFGGGEPLKGYVERRFDALAEQIRALIAEGLYVVLVPNGLPWGSARHAREVAGRLRPAEQEQIVVAPDLAGGRGDVTYEHAGRHRVPYASYQMRLNTYFVWFADLVV